MGKSLLYFEGVCWEDGAGLRLGWLLAERVDGWGWQGSSWVHPGMGRCIQERLRKLT